MARLVRACEQMRRELDGEKADRALSPSPSGDDETSAATDSREMGGRSLQREAQGDVPVPGRGVRPAGDGGLLGSAPLVLPGFNESQVRSAQVEGLPGGLTIWLSNALPAPKLCRSQGNNLGRRPHGMGGRDLATMVRYAMTLVC